MIEGAYISYLRVSTVRQGRSGLGLEAQRQAVASFVGANAVRIAEIVETESGKNDKRPQLDQALALSRLHRVPLVVAKVDRLTRSLGFLTQLLKTGVDVRFCDLPKIEGPAGRFMLTQMASVAELEAGFISARTKAALQSKKAYYEKLTDDERELLKAQGKAVTLGGNRGVVMTAETREKGSQALTAKARARAAEVAPAIRDLQAAGITGLRALARALTERQIPTPRDGKAWEPAQVKNLLAAMESAASTATVATAS